MMDWSHLIFRKLLQFPQDLAQNELLDELSAMPSKKHLMSLLYLPLCPILTQTAA